MKTWLLGVVLVSFAASLAQQLAPKGREQAAVRLVGGLLLVLALLRPLADVFSWRGEAQAASGLFSTSREVAEAYKKDSLDQFSAVIEEKTEAYIWNKAQALGLDCGVEVTAATGESGLPLPERVTLTGAYSQDLADWIAEEVGIPAEQQIWLEVSGYG